MKRWIDVMKKKIIDKEIEREIDGEKNNENEI